MASRHWWSPPSSNSEQDLTEWALRMWRRMDRDNSGSLSRQELDCEEFFTIIRSVLLPSIQTNTGTGGPAYARAEMDMNQAIVFALRKADLNHDGKLSFEEFKSFVSCLRQPHLATHTANLIFALFDLNRDQWVDEFEFRQIYRFYAGHIPTEEQFQDEWARLDQSNRGRVNRDEYVRWLQTSINPVFKDHAPSPSSKVMSGTADFHLAKRQGMTDTFSPAAAELPQAASSAPTPWRPWHAYSNMAWAQVHQVKAGEAPPRSSESMSTQRMTRSAGSLTCPRWNQRLATSNTNWPDAGGKPRRPQGMRTFMSVPQSPSELQNHYSTNPGMQGLARSSRQPQMQFRQQSMYSTDRIEVRQSPELLANRSKFKHGLMKNPKTGKKQYWEDNWQSPPQLRDRYVSGTNSFRCPGKPPRYMYVDEYEDPE